MINAWRNAHRHAGNHQTAWHLVHSNAEIFTLMSVSLNACPPSTVVDTALLILPKRSIDHLRIPIKRELPHKILPFLTLSPHT